jgi:hypothetical protein
MAQSLQWGVKESFRAYLASVADGTTEAGAGAAILDDATFEFSAAPGPVDRHDEYCFVGEVRFAAHHGMMFVMVVDPIVTRSDAEWELTVVDLAYWPGRNHRLTFAHLGEPLATPSGLEFRDVRLAEGGAEDFGGNYPPGVELDPLVVLLSADGEQPRRTG